MTSMHQPSYMPRLRLVDAIALLSQSGFRTFVLERGTLCAYKGGASYGFAPREGLYSQDAITRAIRDHASAAGDREG